MFKRYLKNQRGLTLIELLAVIVILGIIAAIAVPSIGGLIGNSKKDATAANAIQMVNSTKLYIAGSDLSVTTTPIYVSLQDLYKEKQIETMKDPFGGTYAAGAETTTANRGTEPVDTTSYVEVKLDSADANKTLYTVNLVSSKGKVIAKKEVAAINRSAVVAP